MSAADRSGDSPAGRRRRGSGACLVDAARGRLLDPDAAAARPGGRFTDDRVARETVAPLTAALAEGSYLVISHATPDFEPPTISAVTRVHHDQGIPFAPRSREQLARLLSDVDVLAPGIMPAHRWLADGIEPAGWDGEVSLYAAAARIGSR